MTPTRRTFLAAAAAGSPTALVVAQGPKGDPLPSWADGAAKRAILAFVARTTTEGSPDFVPPPDRVAVFDNDGTLWPENPVPFQVAFLLHSLRQRLPDNPAWAADPFVTAALGGDIAALLADQYKGLFHVIGLTHAGMTTDEFEARVNDWLATAKHPRYGRRYDECVYQPMLEVLAHLRAVGFKTFIASGGGAGGSERPTSYAPLFRGARGTASSYAA